MLEEVQLEKRRPEELDEVDYEAFDVGAIVILIGHDNEMTVAEVFGTGVHGVVPKGQQASVEFGTSVQ